MNTRTVTSLWVGGELPLMSVLCIKSFLDHGHTFQLFTYRNYDNIPAGTLVRDARDILPEEAIFHDSHNSLAPFSDWFRMKFLSQEGGFWVDMDVICLGDELPASPLWFCREWAEVVAVGAMAFPPGHSVPATLCRLAEDPALRVPWDSPEEVRAKEELLRRVPDVADRRRQVPWGFCGPTGMTRALRHCGLFDRAAPSSHMYPVPWTRWRDCYNGNIRLAGPELSNAWCVHLWGEMARREPDAWENMSRNSMAGELLDRHLPGHAWKPAPGPRKKVNILVGICSCTGAANRRKACRETWLSHPQEGVECRFFLGRRTPLPNEPDVVALWVEDDYRHLPAKGLAFYQYALEHYDFDWLFKCDDDTARDKKNYGDTDVSKAAYPKFLEKLSICRDLFHGFSYEKFMTGSDLDRAKLISGGVNFILGKSVAEYELPDHEKTQNVFIKEALLLKQALSLCSSLVDEQTRMEAAFFESVRTMTVRLVSGGTGKKFTLPEVNERINELLKHSIKSEGVINLFSDVQTEFSLFDPKFLEEVANMKEKNLAVELLKKLISEQVSVYRRTNIVKSEKFSEIIQSAMNRYLNGMLTNEEVIQELLKLAKDIAAAAAEGEKLGLTAEELAFYDALTKPQAIKDFYEHDELIAITKELTDLLRKNRTIDWQKKESARAGMRRLVKRLLKKHKYPPDGMDDAVQTVMSQCEMWVDNT